MLNKIILQSVTHNQSQCDILIEGNRFRSIGKQLTKADYENAEVIDCKNFAILPAFYNAHCHAAMSLFRGYADDKPLQEWLTKYIWPIEAKLNERYVEIGSRLAVLEMIKSGTVFFSDMYYNRTATMKVVEEMGIRATIGVSIADKITPADLIEKHFQFLKNHNGESERVKLAVMPHAIYTISTDCLRRCAEIAQNENYLIHTHLSETKQEVDDCISEYHCSPVELMDRFNILNQNFIGAHCVHFLDSDYRLFAQAGAKAVANVCSNLKLQSGIPHIARLKKYGIPVAIGTDGASSNNNLDMQEEMKVAALITNVASDVKYPAQEFLSMATEVGAKTYGIQNAGKIEEGYLADCILLSLNNVRLTPNNNLISNWVYAANSEAIDSVMCNGTFVMRNRHVDGEENIIAEAQRAVKELMQ